MPLIDITPPMTSPSARYPGDPRFEREVLLSPGQGAGFELARLSMSAHCGAHLDAPAHFISGGRRLGDYGVGAFVLPALVVDILDPVHVTPRELDGAGLAKGQAILFRTQNSRSKQEGRVPLAKTAHLSPAAAEWAVKRGAALVGLESLSVDADGDETYPVHRCLLGAGTLVLEGLDLTHAPAGRYTLLCLPLNIADAEASPVRAVLAPPDWAQGR